MIVWLIQFTQYLSDCGGVLGLWLGMSVLTIFEFVEFALDISVLAIVELVLNVTNKRDTKRRKNRVQPQSSSKQSPPPPPPNAPVSPEPRPPSTARPPSARPTSADQLVEARHPNEPSYD